MSFDFMTECECITETNGDTVLVCVDSCERCDEEAKICGLANYTEIYTTDGNIDKAIDCLEYTEGPHEGDVLCFEMVLDPLFNLVGCDINVNGVSCDSCEISIEPCGLQANEAEFMVADCRNVDEIGYEVNECTHTDYTGILSSFFTSYDHVGACVVDGSLSFGENSTEGGATGGQNRTEGEGVCYEEAFFQEDFWPEFERSCNCTGNEDGTTTLYCIDGCESCTFQADVCGRYSFSSTFEGEAFYASQFEECFEYSKGDFKGNSVCFESISNATSIARNYFFVETGPCRLSVNGVNCVSCVVEEKNSCGFSGYNYYLKADCTNNEIGQVVDECDGETFHGLLAFIYHDLFEIGSCEIAHADNTSTLPPLYLPPDKNDNGTTTPSNDTETDDTNTTNGTEPNSGAFSVVVPLITAVLMTLVAVVASIY
jgi:hypothetical protein